MSNWYSNPTKPHHSILKTAIQLVDPTGISGYGDFVRSIKDFNGNPTLVGVLIYC